MFRLVGILVAIGLVAWLSMKQLDGAGSSASRAAEAAAQEAGVDDADAMRIDPGSSPGQIAAQVGQQVEATIAAGKSRVDDFERDAGGSATRGEDSADGR